MKLKAFFCIIKANRNNIFERWECLTLNLSTLNWFKIITQWDYETLKGCINTASQEDQTQPRFYFHKFLYWIKIFSVNIVKRHTKSSCKNNFSYVKSIQVMNSLVISFITKSSCYREIKVEKAYCILFKKLIGSDNCSTVYVGLSDIRKYIQVFTLERNRLDNSYPNFPTTIWFFSKHFLLFLGLRQKNLRISINHYDIFWDRFIFHVWIFEKMSLLKY